MLYVLGVLGAAIAAIAAIIIIPSLVLPLIYAYVGNYRQSLIWMRRYFRHDMALYSPLDLVYLYMINGQLDEVEAVYRAYEQKGNRGSQYFVRLWVAARQGNWQAAEIAFAEVEKYTITSDIDLKGISSAIRDRNVTVIDDAYLIDMNGRTTITPSLFRVTWVAVLGAAGFAAAVGVIVWMLAEAKNFWV